MESGARREGTLTTVVLVTAIRSRVTAFHCTQHMEPLTTRSGADENPRERPKATQERSRHEMGRVDEEHMTLPRKGGVQPRPQFRVEKLGLGFDVLGQVFWGGTGMARTHCHFMPRSLRNFRP
jgi:hypothetical protein